MKKITNILSFRELPNPTIRSWVIGIVLCLSYVLPATLVVPTDYPNIQAGIDASASGDTVLVLDGVYSGEGNVNIEIDHRDNLLIMSENGADDCIIILNENEFAFNLFQSDNILLKGMSIINNSNSYSISGIYCENNIIDRCVFIKNIDIYPYTIFSFSNEFIFTNCIIYYNPTIENPVFISTFGFDRGDFYNSILFGIMEYEHPYYFHNCMFNIEGPGSGGQLVGDPLLFNPEENNFHLQLESPCINAGGIYSDLTSFDNDGTQPDIGAFSYLLEIIGDSNFDGIINILDIIETVSTIIGSNIPFNAQIWAQDYNEDDLINVLDIILLVQYIVNN